MVTHTAIAGKTKINNLNKLQLRFASRLAVPDGGGIADAIEFLTNGGKRCEILKEAKRRTSEAIEAVRQAGEPNPYKTMNDDEIAGVIMQQIEANPRPFV